jgi:hypothetical protein
MSRFALVLASCLIAVSCTGGQTRSPVPIQPAPYSPSPPGESAIATTPVGLAAQLQRVTADLHRSVDAWRAAGGASVWPPPTQLVLQALMQQRIYGALSRHPRLLRNVLPRLPADLRGEARATARAGALLLSLGRATSPAPAFRTKAPLPAETLLGYYREARRRFGVAWQVLAAINFVESRFGRVISNSSAGAQGPMQFIRLTWRAYGLGGNVHNPHDAILGAANYLHASGAPGDYPGAIYHYNPASTYVRAVLLYARQMMGDPRTFYAYYNWQVFALTPSGLEQITGPGA